MVDVVILAGALNDGALKESSSEKYEALIEIAGRPMVEYVLEAVRGSAFGERVALIGPEKKLREKLSLHADAYVEGGDSLFHNIRLGATALDSQGPVLLITSDIPLITPEAIDDFVKKARSREGEVYYSLINQEACEKTFPGMERTYVKLQEGMYTGGNLGMVEADIIRNCSEEMSQFFTHRKSTLQLSRILGPNILLRFALGRLKLAQIEKRIKKTTGYNGVGVLSNHAEIAFDVDKPSDLELASRFLEERKMEKRGAPGEKE